MYDASPPAVGSPAPLAESSHTAHTVHDAGLLLPAVSFRRLKCAYTRRCERNAEPEGSGDLSEVAPETAESGQVVYLTEGGQCLAAICLLQ
jgi:hypothetical protein